MAALDRRSFMQLGTAGLVSCVLPSILQAEATTKFKRSAVHTVEGKAMLAIYAAGVKELTDTSKFSEADPRSWTFQWYTHAVPSNRTKAAELKRLYPAADPRKNIATAMWDTCEAHTDSSRENFFLPWHRMYVSSFEKIIRFVTGESGFALPYWDYTDPHQRALPEEFRRPSDPIWKSLYRATRNAHVNSGAPIDSAPSSAALSIDSLRSTTYEDAVADAGFCANLDGFLHGAVHVDVGNAQGMGQVPWAAGDPIFWLHHCNIDRIWASWNRSGGVNLAEASFLSERFQFADSSGKQVSLSVSDFMSMPGYEYDAYVDRPIGSPPFKATGPLFVAQHASSESAATMIALGQSVSFRLSKPIRGLAGTPLPVAAPLIKDIAPNLSLHLRLEQISASADPNTSFDVFVTSNARPLNGRKDPAFVGSLPFFGIGHQHAHAHMQKTTAAARNASFILNEQIRLELSDAGTNLPFVTIVANGQLSKSARPTIGRILLVSA